MGRGCFVVMDLAGFAEQHNLPNPSPQNNQVAAYVIPFPLALNRHHHSYHSSPPTISTIDSLYRCNICSDLL